MFIKAVNTRFLEPYKENKNGKLITNIPFLNAEKKQSGVYFIKSKRTGDIVYIGYSENNLYTTIYRHFQKWEDIQREKKTRFTYSKTGYKVRCILTTPARAALLEKYLIMKFKPRDNSLKYENYLSEDQQQSCMKILEASETMNKTDEYPF